MFTLGLKEETIQIQLNQEQMFPYEASNVKVNKRIIKASMVIIWAYIKTPEMKKPYTIILAYKITTSD